MKVLLFILSLAATSTALAQTGVTNYSTARKVVKSGSKSTFSQLTPEFSYTGSILDGDSTQQLDGQREGVGAGVRVDIGKTDFVFETGFIYRQMGGIAFLLTDEEARTNGNNNRLESDVELNYFSIPLMAKYYFNGRQNSSFFTRAGLQPSLLAFREARLRAPTPTAVKDLSHINEFDLIGAVGMGFQIPINETTMAVFEGTYLRGFTSVFNNMALYHNGFSGSFGLGILL